MDVIAIAFGKRWFYAAALLIGFMYGLGGLVHIGNILGFGELTWSQAPLPWRLGDIFWGTLDIVGLIGIIVRAPVGILAVALAALTQVATYGLFPEVFALNEEHRYILRGLVYFNASVLLVLGVLIYLAGVRSGT